MGRQRVQVQRHGAEGGVAVGESGCNAGDDQGAIAAPQRILKYARQKAEQHQAIAVLQCESEETNLQQRRRQGV